MPSKPYTKLPASKAITYDETIVASDIHFPFQDSAAVRLWLAVVAARYKEAIKNKRKFRIVLAGDIVDFYTISKFSKDPTRQESLQDELDACVDFLIKLRQIAPLAEIVFVEGNHEARLRNYIISNAGELASLRDMTVERQLRLAELGMTYVNSKGRTAYYMVGDIAVGHWKNCNQNSGYTATNILAKRGVSVAQGHVHRLAVIHRTLLGGRVLKGIETGCLCDLNPEYDESPDWQQGFVIIRELSNGITDAQAIQINGGVCVLDGRIYEDAA